MTEGKTMKMFIPDYEDYTYEYKVLPNYEIDKDACIFIKNNKTGEHVRPKVGKKGAYVMLENIKGSRSVSLSKIYKTVEFKLCKQKLRMDSLSQAPAGHYYEPECQICTGMNMHWHEIS